MSVLDKRGGSGRAPPAALVYRVSQLAKDLCGQARLSKGQFASLFYRHFSVIVVVIG